MNRAGPGRAPSAGRIPSRPGACPATSRRATRREGTGARDPSWTPQRLPSGSTPTSQSGRAVRGSGHGGPLHRSSSPIPAPVTRSSRPSPEPLPRPDASQPKAGKGDGGEWRRGRSGQGSLMTRPRPWARFEPDVAARDGHERAGGVLGPGPAVEVADAVDLGDQGQVGVAAGHVAEPLASGVLGRPTARSAGCSAATLRDPADPPRGAVRASISGCSRRARRRLGQPAVVGDERVELVAVEDQELGPGRCR